MEEHVETTYLYICTCACASPRLPVERMLLIVDVQGAGALGRGVHLLEYDVKGVSGAALAALVELRARRVSHW